MFQGYTLGNILSAQFHDAAQRAEYSSLFAWLRDNVYRHGSKFTLSELIERATGKELTIEPYVNYLRGKLLALYRLT